MPVCDNHEVLIETHHKVFGPYEQRLSFLDSGLEPQNPTWLCTYSMIVHLL